jgi:hypothetical protein
MSKLPMDKIRWLSSNVFDKIDWMSIDTEGSNGYILEVDLEYPDELHESHDNFPLAPENIQIDYKSLSPYSKQSLYESTKTKKFSDIKLSATFLPRKKYVLHFKNLKLYLNLGLKLKTIHRVLKFQQKNFIAPFIEKCTFERQKATTKFEQDQFKKVANSTYGKTIQNVRNYLQVKLHMTSKSVLKSISNPTYKNYVIIDEFLVQTNHYNPIIVHDKPIIIGFTILELSKHFMYDFFYNKLLKDNPCKIDLGFSDTDSFLFKSDKPKKLRSHLKPFMDFSNYPTDHKSFDNKNKAQLGFFKDELGGKSICKEFIGLRAKCYSMKIRNLKTNKISEKKTCKGLGRIAIENRLTFKHYKNCLFKKSPLRMHYNSIQSKKQIVKTVLIRKKALSHFDCKRWLFDCGIHSVPYGSHFIPKYFNTCFKCL